MSLEAAEEKVTVADLAVVWENLEIDSQPKQRVKKLCMYLDINGVIMKKHSKWNKVMASNASIPLTDLFFQNIGHLSLQYPTIFKVCI